MTFPLTDNARKTLTALREADESQRTRGTVMSVTGNRMCACAVMAKALGISVTWETVTGDLVRRLAEKTGIPHHVMERVPALNDAILSADDRNYSYAWREIADEIERAAEQAEVPV